jgi:hypothetical protein
MPQREVREVRGKPQGGPSTPSIDFTRQQMSRGELSHRYSSTEKKRLDQEQEQFERVASGYGQQMPWTMPGRGAAMTFLPDLRPGEEGVLTLGNQVRQRTYRTMDQAREALDRRLEAGRLGTHKNIQARIDELRSRSPESDDHTDQEYNRLPKRTPNPPRHSAHATEPGRNALALRTRENPLLRGLHKQLADTANRPPASTDKGKSRAIDPVERSVASSSRHGDDTTAPELHTTSALDALSSQEQILYHQQLALYRQGRASEITQEMRDAKNKYQRAWKKSKLELKDPNNERLKPLPREGTLARRYANRHLHLNLKRDVQYPSTVLKAIKQETGRDLSLQELMRKAHSYYDDPDRYSSDGPDGRG